MPLMHNGQYKSCIAAIVRQSASITSKVLRAAVNNPKSLTIENTSDAGILYVAFAPTASATAFTLSLAPGARWVCSEMELYDGIISGIWAAATGAALVTSVTLAA